MALRGTLSRWDDGRGFGFIAPTGGGAEVFVHIGSFARDGSRPTVGERVSFEVDRGPDGRPRAVNVVRLAIGSATPGRARETRVARPAAGLFGILAVLAIVAAIGSWGWSHLSARRHRSELAAQPATASVPEAALSTGGLRCDGRTLCSQMTSCAEATWFINHCPGTRMDGNGDGVPCEQQWCTGMGAR